MVFIFSGQDTRLKGCVFGYHGLVAWLVTRRSFSNPPSFCHPSRFCLCTGAHKPLPSGPKHIHPPIPKPDWPVTIWRASLSIFTGVQVISLAVTTGTTPVSCAWAPLQAADDGDMVMARRFLWLPGARVRCLESPRWRLGRAVASDGLISGQLTPAAGPRISQDIPLIHTRSGGG